LGRPQPEENKKAAAQDQLEEPMKPLDQARASEAAQSQA
jgi:hypothetical protein